MRYWNTPDEVTNTNLGYLEALAEDRSPPFDAERLTQKYVGAIEVMKMLPSTMRLHFNVDLYIGDLAYSWSGDRRNRKALELCDALALGLEKIASEPAFQKGGAADLSDRPKSKGEVMLAALAAFQARFPSGHFYNELSALRTATYGSPLHRHVAEIDRILSRKNWSEPNSREYEIYRKIHDMEFLAARFHRERA